LPEATDISRRDVPIQKGSRLKATLIRAVSLFHWAENAGVVPRMVLWGSAGASESRVAALDALWRCGA
jgi:hypothetical protein